VPDMARIKRKLSQFTPLEKLPDTKKARQNRKDLITAQKRKNQHNNDKNTKRIKQDDVYGISFDISHSYLYNKQGMVSYSPKYIEYLKESYEERSYIGKPEFICKYCNAMFWYNERNKKGTYKNKEPTYSNCCKNGIIKIPKYKEPPTFLQNLLQNKDHPVSKHFFEKIRQYNSMFSFTSMGANIVREINKGDGPYVFKINGQIHHRIGSLIPSDDNEPQYAELYIFDTQNEIRNRIKALHKQEPSEVEIDPQIVKQLKDMLDENNPLVKTFRYARDMLDKYKDIELSIRIVGANKGDPVQYEMPHTDELALLIVGDFTLEKCQRDIIVSTKQKELHRITIFHPAYMALQYPLLFPYGERGFQLGIPYYEKGKEQTTKTKRKTVTMHEYYKYRMHYRPGQPNPFLSYGRLSKQAIVDARAMEDEDRLMYISRNQDKLRVEYLQGIFDAVEKGINDGSQIGKKVLLPSSHVGSRRYTIQNYHDGVAICRVYGPPDLFIINIYM
jgi:hypothetical protein